MTSDSAASTKARPDGSAANRLKRWLASLTRRPAVQPEGITRIERRYIYILPTRTGLLLALVLSLMLLGSLNYQNNIALLFTFLMVSVSFVVMFHTWLNLLDLRIAAKGGAPVFAGKDAMFSFSLEDDSNRNRGDLRLQINKHVTTLNFLARRSTGTVSLGIRTVDRGWTSTDGLRLETRYPLGLFRAWTYPNTHARVMVYPRPAAEGPTPKPVPALKSSDQGDLGVGADDFVGPRDYRPGDSPRRLDWKALARERGLVVKQFGGDRAAQVWIDWDCLPAADTEKRLSLLCRQVLDAAAEGLSYGLRLPGIAVAVGHGEVHKHRCLAILAEFDHG